MPGRGHCDDCACSSKCMIGRLQAPQRQAIQPLIHERSFHKGQVLLHQGEPAPALHVVKVGSILTSRKGPDGRPRPIGIFGCGHVLDTFAFTGQPTLLTSRAVSAGRLCEVQARRLLDEQPRDSPLLQQLDAARVRFCAGLADWAQVMRVRGVTGQVAAALLQLGAEQRSRLVRLPSQSALAELLGTTRETIARALSRLQAQHCVIRRDRWHCELLEAPLLARIAASP